jgi:putative addiction module killer protein
MIKLVKSDEFIDWFNHLRDIRARDRIIARFLRLQLGQFADVKSVGDGVSELRVDYGPGYRIYIKLYGAELILLLIGGDKGSQARDIKRAKEIAAALAEANKKD